MAFRIPALQLLLTPYELPMGPVGPSKSDSGDCNLERKKVCTVPRKAGGADTSQECSGPEAFISAGPVLRTGHASGPAPQRPGTPCCITCELLVVTVLQHFPRLPLVSEAHAPLPVLFVYCLVTLLYGTHQGHRHLQAAPLDLLPTACVAGTSSHVPLEDTCSLIALESLANPPLILMKCGFAF